MRDECKFKVDRSQAPGLGEAVVLIYCTFDGAMDMLPYIHNAKGVVEGESDSTMSIGGAPWDLRLRNRKRSGTPRTIVDCHHACYDVI